MELLEYLKNWNGKVEVDGKEYNKISDVVLSGTPTHIVLHSFLGQFHKDEEPNPIVETKSGEIRFTVKPYMTKQATPEFDFMAKWNNNIPMPLRTMTGTIDKETRGMVHVQLHGDIWAEKICHCMKCGKVLTNPVSQYFGIGPECGGHNYVNPFDDEEQLKEAVEDYKAKLRAITWEGWIIRSAILERVEL